jgi:hypothetical protein
MGKQGRWVRVGLAGVMVLVGSLGASARAGDCVSVELRVWTSGNPNPSYPAGPKHCVTPDTPWNESLGPHVDPKVGVVPSGYPNGAGVTVWIPAP